MLIAKFSYKYVGVKYIQVLVCAAVFSRANASPLISQTEVNSVVDNEILQCIHDEDAEAFERDLLERGASHEMLALAYYTAMERTKNILSGNDETAQFSAATYGFARFANASQLTNLLQIAESTSNDLNAANAIFSFHSRVTESVDFVYWGKRMLGNNNASARVKAAIWECFTKELKLDSVSENVKTNILDIAGKSLAGSASSVFYADRILADFDHIYGQSESRKEIARGMISNTNKVETNEVLLRYFQSILKDAVPK